MSRAWAFADDSIVVCGPGGASGIGSSAHTILAYVKPAATTTGVIQFRAGTTPVRSLLADSGKYYADNDFTGGPTPESGVWQVVGYSKAAGSAVVRWHYYSATTGVWAHSNGATLGDPGGTIDNIWLGKAYNRGNLSIAAIGAWSSALTDGNVETAGFAALQQWYNLSPLALWPMNQSGTNPFLDVIGSADESSITNARPAADTDPSGWDYTISSGLTQALPTASYTESGVVLGRRKTRALPVVTSTDTAIALAGRKTRALVVATTADVAVALGRTKTRALPVAAETSSGLVLVASKRRALPVAAETDTAVEFGGADPVGEPAGSGPRRVLTNVTGRHVQATPRGRRA